MILVVDMLKDDEEWKEDEVRVAKNAERAVLGSEAKIVEDKMMFCKILSGILLYN